jgi:hypothetical protein
MAHTATKRFTYWGQLGILMALAGVGLIVGGIVSMIPLLAKMDISQLKSFSAPAFMDAILKPENANALRVMQFISIDAFGVY